MPSFIFVVEHLDEELGPWSRLEYECIAQESYDASCNFILSSVPQEPEITKQLESIEHAQLEHEGIETLFADRKTKVCLLDPAAKHELSPEDGEVFDVFLFGGILGDDPPRDRTSELRKKGFEGRRLGPKQMTTDTAVRVTRTIVKEKVPLDKIPYLDYPELKLNEHESTEMPFRYVKGQDGKPIMPAGMFDLIRADADKGFGDLL